MTSLRTFLLAAGLLCGAALWSASPAYGQDEHSGGTSPTIGTAMVIERPATAPQPLPDTGLDDTEAMVLIGTGLFLSGALILSASERRKSRR